MSRMLRPPYTIPLSRAAARSWCQCSKTQPYGFRLKGERVMTIYIEEFLYRGKAPSTGETEAWHVVLGNEIDNGFGQMVVNISNPMTPSQAQAVGFPLPVILASINTIIMDQLDAEKAKSADLTAQLDAEKAKSADLTAQLDADTSTL